MSQNQRKPITLYLDMDEVIADFRGHWQREVNAPFSAEKFRELVLRDDLFEKLDTLSGAESLYQVVQGLLQGCKNRRVDERDFALEVLTSVGTTDAEVAAAVAYQKTNWMRKFVARADPGGEMPKMNFVTDGLLKAQYAHPHAYLIDDRHSVVQLFMKQQGQAFLYTHHFLDYYRQSELCDVHIAVNTWCASMLELDK